MFQGSIEGDARRVQSMRAMGASQIGGGNSLAGNQCQRWLALFTVFGRDAVQAPGLALRWRPVSWACEGRHKAGTYRELTGLKERRVANPSRAGTRPECRHQVGEACCRRGGVAGAEPPHKGGPNRPDRPELQWSVVSGQRRRFTSFRVESGRDMAPVAARGTGKFTPILGCTPGYSSTVRVTVYETDRPAGCRASRRGG